jgi:hypothetical protein
MNDEIKTVTHEGKVYQIGKIYLVDDGGDFWLPLVLRAIETGSSHPFRGRHVGYKLCKEALLDAVGTITPAPIELVDGAAYMFDSIEDKDFLGIYAKSTDRLYYANGRYSNAEQCTSIRLMTVESK